MTRAAVLSALLSCGCSLLRPPEPVARERPEVSVAVLAVTAKNLEPRLTTMLTGVLTTEAHGVVGYRVTTADDINATLALEKQKDLLDCEDVACMAEIGGALGVDRILATSVGTVGETYVVNMSLIDSGSGAALARATEDGRGQPDLLIPLVRRAAHALFDLPGDPPPIPEELTLLEPAPAPEPGSESEPEPVVQSQPVVVGSPPPPHRRRSRPRPGGLTVTSLTPDASVVVFAPNGHAAKSGRLPWSNDRLMPGEYRLRVSATGYKTKTVRVRVRADETDAVVVQLEPGSSGVTVEEEPPPAAASESRGPWLPCPVGQVMRGRTCRGAPASLTWEQARYACPNGYGLPMHEELLALLQCGDAGCRSCSDSPACHEQFGNDRGRYWTASSVFNEAFVVDFGRGAVDRVAKDEPQRVHCKRR